MLVKNFYKYIQNMVNVPYQNARQDVNIGCLDLSGNAIVACVNVSTSDGQPDSAMWNRVYHSSNASISVGGSDSSPNDDELYDLVSPFSNIGVSNISVITAGENNKCSLLITGTITNNNTDDIVIKEVGLLKIFQLYAHQGSRVSLMGRVVLDSPITLTVGSSANVSINTEFMN